MGRSTVKNGQSYWYVGYRKHTIRLWLVHYEPAVLLVPLVSWLTPANVGENGLLIAAQALPVNEDERRPLTSGRRLSNPLREPDVVTPQAHLGLYRPRAGQVAV